MPAKMCHICGGAAHPIGPEFVPERRDAIGKTIYIVMRRRIREQRNEAWHAISDGLRDMFTMGTGYLQFPLKDRVYRLLGGDGNGFYRVRQ